MDISVLYQPLSNDKNQPKPLSQTQLNDLITDLVLLKKVCPASWFMSGWKQFIKIIYFWCQKRNKFCTFFVVHDNILFIYCKNIGKVIKALGLAYSPAKWKLFIDLSNGSLKAVLQKCLEVQLFQFWWSKTIFQCLVNLYCVCVCVYACIYLNQFHMYAYTKFSYKSSFFILL